LGVRGGPNGGGGKAQRNRGQKPTWFCKTKKKHKKKQPFAHVGKGSPGKNSSIREAPPHHPSRLKALTKLDAPFFSLKLSFREREDNENAEQKGYPWGQNRKGELVTVDQRLRSKT